MTSYDYTKGPIRIQKLTRQIQDDATIITALAGIDFYAPDSLTINFASSLSGAEKTELDTVVANHNVTWDSYRLHCNTCDEDYYNQEAAVPTECPVCESVNIVNVLKNPGKVTTAHSRNGVQWQITIRNNGTLQTSKIVD